MIEARYTPYDYAEVIYRRFGIEMHKRLTKADGRPVEFTDDGKPIQELF